MNYYKMPNNSIVATIGHLDAEKISKKEFEKLMLKSSSAASPVVYDIITSMAFAVQLLTADKKPTTADERIKCGALYPEWAAGAHTAGEIYTTPGQVWECYQAYDNAVYPDIKPDNAAWYTFNRPLHGATPETARPFVQPTGAHDMYHAGEHAIFEGKMYRCKSDTAYSPTDYAQAWEVAQ